MLKNKILYSILFLASNKFIVSSVLFLLSAVAYFVDFKLIALLLFVAGLIPLAFYYIWSKTNVQ